MASAYSEEQIDRYLEYISFPEPYRRKNNPKRDLELLTLLHVYQISAIPYENLTLHYSKDRQILLEPQVLYEKLLQNGRGGYCMENSIFFSHILRGMGFNAYTAGVRIRLRTEGVPEGDYIGWYE
jgi:arylamine N-acetyltransferase